MVVLAYKIRYFRDGSIFDVHKLTLIITYVETKISLNGIFGRFLQDTSRRLHANVSNFIFKILEGFQSVE